MGSVSSIIIRLPASFFSMRSGRGATGAMSLHIGSGWCLLSPAQPAQFSISQPIRMSKGSRIFSTSPSPGSMRGSVRYLRIPVYASKMAFRLNKYATDDLGSLSTQEDAHPKTPERENQGTIEISNPIIGWACQKQSDQIVRLNI